MPFVNVKFVREQVSVQKRKEFITGLTDLIVTIMGRERSTTIITVDELEKNQWAIGGVTLDDQEIERKVVSFVNIKVSKGTTNPGEMTTMIKAIKDLHIKVFQSAEDTNYVIIDELNPDGWGFNGISMTIRNQLEQG